MNSDTHLNDDAHFDAMYAHTQDPWHLRASWYEQRKRAVLLASLPAKCYGSAYEPACANGELTLALARRCRKLLATDGSRQAVSHASELLVHARHVVVARAWLPDEWPDERFDLVVLSEFLYYLAPEALDALLACARASLNPGATLIACHWRPAIEGCTLAGDAVHARAHARLGLPRIARYLDKDFRLDVWQDGMTSLAEREGRR